MPFESTSLLPGGFDPLNTFVGAILGAAISVPVGLWVSGLYDEMKQRKREKENRVEITSPIPGQTLQNPQPMFPGMFNSSTLYPVTGRLGYLPDEHEIWLLVQDPNTDRIWPQGHIKVTYYPDSGTWSGFVRADPGQIRIVAVVAPPTSWRMFAYYQQHGSQTNWDPLYGIPDECKNRATIQARA